jgi:hypothetical protein
LEISILGEQVYEKTIDFSTNKKWNHEQTTNQGLTF